MKWTIVWRLYKRKSPPERGLVMRGSNGKIDLRDWKDKVGSLPLDFLAESSQGRRPHRICRPQITKDLADRILRGCAGFDPLQKADEGPVGRVLVVGKFGHFQTTQNHHSDLEAFPRNRAIDLAKPHSDVFFPRVASRH